MGNKYDRKIWDKYEDRHCVVDVYRVLDAFDVRCPATAHAVKKLLCAGIRGHKDMEQDLSEAAQSIEEARAILKQKRRAGRTQAEAPVEPQIQPLPHSFKPGDEVACLNTGTYSNAIKVGQQDIIQCGQIGNVVEVTPSFLAVQFYNPHCCVLMRSIHIGKVMKGGLDNGQ